MKDKYTYEEIAAATRLMLSEQRQSIAKIAEETGIKRFRIKTWRKRWRNIEQNEIFQQNHIVTLKCLSNLTYGVSSDVWNEWLTAIDNAIAMIEGLTLTNDILAILQEIARQINARLAVKAKAAQILIKFIISQLKRYLRHDRVARIAHRLAKGLIAVRSV